MSETKKILIPLIILAIIMFILVSVGRNVRENYEPTVVPGISDTPHENEEVRYFTCSDGLKGTIEHHVRNTIDEIVFTADGMTTILEREQTVAGTRYESSDGRLVFQEKGGLGFVQIDGVLAHEDCVLE